MLCYCSIADEKNFWNKTKDILTNDILFEYQ